MSHNPTVIDHPSQLNALSTLPLFRPLNRSPIQLAGGLEKHPKRDAWEKDINQLMRSCGCGTAANGLLLGIIAAALTISYQLIAGDEGVSLLRSIALVAGLAIAGAIAGKLTGLAAANRKLKGLIATIQDDWKVESLPGAGGIVCG